MTALLTRNYIINNNLLFAQTLHRHTAEERYPCLSTSV